MANRLGLCKAADGNVGTTKAEVRRRLPFARTSQLKSPPTTPRSRRCFA